MSTSRDIIIKYLNLSLKKGCSFRHYMLQSNLSAIFDKWIQSFFSADTHLSLFQLGCYRVFEKRGKKYTGNNQKYMIYIGKCGYSNRSYLTF